MKFTKKPVTVEAYQWDGHSVIVDGPEWLDDALTDGRLSFENVGTPGVRMSIRTLDSIAFALPGDWIVMGVKGELYPCKPDIFEATYEAVLENVAVPEGFPAPATPTAETPSTEASSEMTHGYEAATQGETPTPATDAPQADPAAKPEDEQ